MSELVLKFDHKPSAKYPNGYWYAYVDGYGYELEATGPTVESTLATLVNEAIKALDNERGLTDE